MEIEWATICAAVESGSDGSINLLGANSAGVLVPDLLPQLPIPVPITLAICVMATVDEAAAGGILNARIGVLGPAGTPAGGTGLVWVFERGKRIDMPGSDARQIVPVRFAFEATAGGGYAIGVQMEGRQAIWLPYYVGDVAEVTG